MTLVAAAILMAGVPAAAQSTSVAVPPMDTTSIGRRPYSRMHMLLEKTIFKVDVLTVDVFVADEDARRIEQLASGRRYSSNLADSIAAIAIGSQDAWLRIEFVRDVSLDQFLDGVDDNLRLVSAAGLIAAEDYEAISEGLPRWFAFLDERRIRKGDQIHYRIHADTLRTVFRAVGGAILLDQTDVGRAPPRAVLGSYFVRKSEFRKALIKSLFDP